MAGHSKWANIKHKKAKEDAKRGKVFTKLIREITVAAKVGGGDITANPRLRLAVDKGFAANMTRDVVERAIARGAGDKDDSNVEEVRYEGYGPGGTAVMVDCMTDNRNRTVAEVRHAFTKNGGNLGTDGSVAYLFSKQGVMTFEPGTDEEKLMEIGLEAGAEDIVTNDDGSIDVITTPEDFMNVKEKLIAAGLKPAQAEVTMNAETYVDVTDQELAEKVVKLTDMLEDLDDVQEVYSNADISEDIMEKIS